VTDVPISPAGAARQEALATLASLASMGQGSVSSVILMVRPPDGVLDFAQLIPTRRALPALNEVVHSAATEYEDSALIDYDSAASTADGEVMWIRIADVEMLQTIVEGTGDPANMPLFDPANVKLAQLKLAAMQVTVAGVTAVFIQALSANQIVARSRRGIGLLIQRGRIDAPRGELLLFSKDVAAIVIGNVAFFKDRVGFQHIFGFLQEMRQQAAATLEAVTQNLRIDGLDLMRTAVTRSPQMLGKMASIQRKLNQYAEYQAALTMDRLTAFVRTHPECEVEVTGEGDEAQFVFRTDAQHRYKILKLLDDDYLQSQLTTLNYATNSKSAPV
jgi:hypothetical protein